jgi:tricarballylate dehydrogenase
MGQRDQITIWLHVLSTNSHKYDVVVVGCGIAGLSAAVSAAQAGARVAILERAPREDRGGQTRWTEALLRMKSESEVSDDFEDHFARNAGHYLDPELIKETSRDWENWPAIVKTLGFTDPDVIATFARGVPPTVAWLKTFGVRFDFLPTYFITASQPRMAPVGGGLALIEGLAAWAEANGIDIFYQTTARELLQNDRGDVIGLRAIAADNSAAEFHGAVVLGSGGFEGNPEMLTHYVGPRARYIRPVARGGYYNKGEGIRMALAIGAAPCGDFGSFHAEPLDPRSGAPEPVVLVFNYGVLVNKLGQRFVDEAPATVDATYEAITRIIFEQPDGIAYVILDTRLDDVPNWKRSVRSDRPPVKADTLPELANKLDIDAVALAATVTAYNAACPASDTFKPLALDGLSTASGLSPMKSNWARPIDRPPFLAWPIICGNCFTFGGLKVDPSARVLNTDGAAIPGLYAAGETMGLYYGTYPGATSVLRGAVFGRIAGAHAATNRAALR